MCLAIEVLLYAVFDRHVKIVPKCIDSDFLCNFFSSPRRPMSANGDLARFYLQSFLSNLYLKCVQHIYLQYLY